MKAFVYKFCLNEIYQKKEICCSMNNLNENELQCSIARSKEIIMGVEQWRKTEYKAKYEELHNLQNELEKEISLEEKYQQKISQKLDQISRLKEMIAEKMPDDNNFRQTYRQ